MRTDMLKRLSVALLAGAVVSACAAGSSFVVDLRTARVECGDMNSVDCRTAATELEKHLALIAGERRPSSDGFVFSVGNRPAGATVEDFKYTARVCGRRMYFWGDEAVHGIENGRGALFAVYEFLDKKLGVRWVFPGDEGIVFKPAPTMTVKDGDEWNYSLPMEVCYFPAYRSFRRVRRTAMPAAFRISKEKFNAKCDAVAEWYARMRFGSRNRHKSGHAFKDWQKRYLKDHPEWFAYITHPDLVRDGKPGRGVKDSQSQRVHGCYSNPELPKAMVADWAEKGAPKRFNLCLNDGKYCHCQCEACLALDASKEGETTTDYISDRVVHLYNGVAAEALKVRKDVDIVAYVYSAYRHPPRRERLLFGDCMTLSWVPSFGDDYVGNLAKWKAAGLKKFYLRPNYMCYSSVFPRGLERYLFDNFKTVMNAGAIGIMYDGTPRPVLDLEYHVLASLYRNPGRGFDDILEEFYAQYGAAAPSAKAYFDNVRNRSERVLKAVVSAKNPLAIRRLDDSELSQFAMLGHTEADLLADLAALSFNEPEKLTPHERRRYENLRLRAENALLAYRFIKTSQSGDQAAFDAATDVLYNFRVKNLSALGDEGRSWFSGTSCELPAWKKTRYMGAKR